MFIKKKVLLNDFKSLPQVVDIDDVIYKLYVRKELMLAEQDIKTGRTLSHEQVMREVRKWSK